MESLRKIFGLRDEDEVISVILVLLIVFFVVLWMLRGCIIAPDLDLSNSEILPFNNTPVIRTDLDDGNLQITGTAAANTEVDVYLDGEFVGTAKADELGQWVQNAEIISSGPHEIQLRSILDDGSEYSSSSYEFDADLDNGEVVSGSGSAVDYLPNVSAGDALSINLGDDNSIIDTGRYLLTGAGIAGSTLYILQDGEQIGTTVVDADGTWSLETELNETGEYIFQAIDEENEDQSTDLLHLIVGDDEDDIEPPTIRIERDDRRWVIPLVGTAEPNSTLVVSLNGDDIATVDVDGSGNWSTEVMREEDIVDYQFIARTVDDGDETLATSNIAKISFQTDVAQVEPTPTAEAPSEVTVDDPEIDLDAVSVDVNGNASGSLPITGEGAPVGARVKIFFNGEEIGETTIGSDGTYSFDYDYSLAPGTYPVTASIVDDSDNELATSNVGQIVIPEAESTLRVVYSAGNGDERAIADSPIVELIFDASWSMTLPPDSNNLEDRLTADDPDSRIGIARDSMLAVVEELPAGIPVALRVFGNRAEPYECQSDLEVELKPLEKEEMIAIIEEIEPQPNANTPIGASLNNVAVDLFEGDIDVGERAVKVVLLTDGEENCGGNPNSAIAGLRTAYNIDVLVDIVGFAIDSDELKEQFEAWADTGGGQYYDATDSEGLIKALELAIQPQYAVFDTDGEQVATGTIGGQPLELDPGDYVVEILNGQDETYEVTIGISAVTIELE